MSLFNELKRRNVFRVGAAYAIFAWVLIQIIDTVLPTFDAPRWIIQTVTFLIILGFPVTLFLAWIFELTPQGLKTDATAQADASIAQASAADFSKVKSQTLNAVILGLVVLAVGFLLLDRFVIGDLSSETTSTTAISFQAPTHRVSLVLPQEAPMSFAFTPNHSLAISPDGETIVYVAIDRNAVAIDTILQLRRLDSLMTRTISGTQGAKQPFFSPDGQWIGFFNTEGDLKKVSLAGGNAITLVEDINGSQWGFAVWLESQEILFKDTSPVIKKVSANGGEVSVLMPLDESRNEISHAAVFPIPETDTVLFTAVSQLENETIFNMQALSLTTGERQLIQEGIIGVQYLDSGHLLFMQDQVIMVAPFDPQQLAFNGPAVALVDEVRRDGQSGEGSRPQMAVSRNGTLAYAPPVDVESRLYLVSRDGSREALEIIPDRYTGISVSPDGQTAALEVRTEEGAETRLYDFNRGTTTLLSQAELDYSASWLPDSRAVTVTSRENNTSGLWIKDMGGRERLLIERLPADPGYRNGSWHPDGRQLAITRQDGGEHDIMLLTFDGEDTDLVNNIQTEPLVEPLITVATNEHSPRISPDGRWLAYLSDKSGSLQVYVRAFPEGEERIVSTGSQSMEPQWSVDGTELYFNQNTANGDQTILWRHAVIVSEEGGSLVISQPEALFPMYTRNASGAQEAYLWAGNSGSGIGLMPDGRFLMALGPSGTRQYEIVLVQNWFTELQEMAPVE